MIPMPLHYQVLPLQSWDKRAFEEVHGVTLSALSASQKSLKQRARQQIAPHLIYHAKV